MIRMRRSIGMLVGLLALGAGVVAVTAWAAGQHASTPQVPEESATIRDDPTIAPDPKQSADNNVSFPNDI